MTTHTIIFPRKAVVKGQGRETAGGCVDKRAASHFLNGVLLLIHKHEPEGLSGLTPVVTPEQHSRFKTGRW